MELLKSHRNDSRKAIYSAPEIKVIALSSDDILQTSLNRMDAASQGDEYEWDIIWN